MPLHSRFQSLMARRRFLFLASGACLASLTTNCGSRQTVAETSTPVATSPNAGLTATSGKGNGTFLGINLTSLSYPGCLPYIDVFKCGQYFDAHKYNLDSKGWVKSIKSGDFAFFLLFIGVNGKFPKGDYTILYEGEGTIEPHLSSTNKMSSPVSLADGRKKITFTIAGSEDVWLKFSKINPSNYIKNVQVLLPGFNESNYNPSQPFNPRWLEFQRPFKVIRFMDWMQTNHNKVQHWNERTALDQAVYSGPTGAPLEHICLAANALGCDAWICVPRRADDDYVRQMATLIKNQLKPDLKVYVQYTNEFWNGLFSEGDFTRPADGKPTSYLAYQGYTQGLSRDPKDDWQAVSNYYSYRSLQIFDIWKTVWGTSQDRIIKVLDTQIANDGVADAVLQFRNAYQQADVLAVAPYFNGGILSDSTKAAEIVNMSQAQIVQHLRDSINKDCRNGIQKHVDKLKNYPNISLVMYESGVDLQTNSFPEQYQQPIFDKFKAVMLSDEMRALTVEYYQMWRSITNNGLANYFADIGGWSKYGFWGIIESLNEDYQKSPKYQAILELTK